MKKILLTFSYSLLIPLLSFSQRDYPKQILWEGDTVILITPHQIDLLNYRSITLKGNRELLKDYQSKIKVLNSNLLIADETEANLRHQIENKGEIADEYEIQIQKINRMKVTKWLYFGIGSASGVFLTYQALKLVSP